MSAARRQRRSPLPPSALRRAGRLRCLLCGDPPTFIGLWLPNDRGRGDLLMPSDGRGGKIVYRLCDRCRLRPGAVGLVEARIIDDIAAARASDPVASN
jgi:hypothetical protein